MATLTTFDVFDTLLTRAVGNPTSVFLLMGRLDAVRTITRCTPDEFAAIRVTAERRARVDRPEVSLRQIYQEVRVGLALDQDSTDTLCRTEVDLERRLSRVVPGATQLLDAHQASRRIAVSDMYLPTNVVSELLESQGLLEHLETVHVSSEHNATKSSGELFRRLQRAEGVRVRDWHHVGDHLMADGRIPKLLGIRAAHLADAKLNRYEEIWESYRTQTGGFSSLIAGASRLARLNADLPPATQPIADVAAGVAAPILTAYVLWVLHCAQREGYRRLYFLARDGEVLLLIAQRLARRLGIDIDLRYLYGSRTVYHRAGLAHSPVEEAKWAWSTLHWMTPLEILTRLGLEESDAQESLRRLGLRNERRRVAADPELVQQIVTDPFVQAAAKQRAEALLGRVQAYLLQEGVADGTPWAIVDTGWKGRVVRSLSDVLPDGSPPLARGYLFGYMKGEGAYDQPDVLRGYLFDEFSDTGYRGHFEDAYGPLETFTVAAHGMTVDFEHQTGQMQPILKTLDNPALTGWPWQQMRDTIFRFVDELVLDPDIAATSADLRSPVADVLSQFWTRPTVPESQAWGSYLYEDDMLAEPRKPLAAAIEVGDFIGKARQSHEGRRLWIPGSVMLSPRAVRPAARAGLWFNAFIQSEAGLRSVVPAKWRNRARLLVLAARTRRG